MPITFHATEVEVTRHAWGQVIVLAADYDDTSEDERYLMLQAKDSYTRDDIKFGSNNIYIECCGQGWSWYGHILEFILRSNTIRVQLDAEAANRMSNDGRIEVSFSIDESKYAALRNTLKHIFKGRTYYAEQLA